MKSFLILSLFCVLWNTKNVQANYIMNSANEDDQYIHQRSRVPSENSELSAFDEEGRFDLAEYLLSTCPNQLPINYVAVRKADACLHRHMEGLNLRQLIFLIASGQFGELSSTICNLWPKINGCLDYLINYLERCHENKYIGKVTGTLFQYACSATRQDDGTSNLGDFLSSGGLSCGNMGKFVKCVRHSSDKTSDICTIVRTVRSCAQASFGECTFQKPWEIASRGFSYLQRELKCGEFEGIH